MFECCRSRRCPIGRDELFQGRTKHWVSPGATGAMLRVVAPMAALAPAPPGQQLVRGRSWAPRACVTRHQFSYNTEVRENRNQKWFYL